MEKKVVLITGALSGIGRAAAFAFAHEDARVIVSGRREDDGESLAKQLRTLGVEAEFIHGDVSEEKDVQLLLEKTVERFGRLDIAVNNAGTEGVSGPISEQTVENFQTTFKTNVLGTFLCLKHELRVMALQKSGSIINISSTYGKKVAPGASIYAASKHAVEGLTKAAALEAASSGVRVNAVAPGPIETQMIARFAGTPERLESIIEGVPLKRLGKPEEVAQLIVFLGSDKAPFITGQILGIDGGKLA